MSDLNTEIDPDDDTMESIINIPAEIKVVRKNTTSRGEDIEKMLSQTITVNDKNVIHEPTCPICSSQYRKEVEQKWIETNGNLEGKKLIKEKTGQDIELVIFENHMKMHLNRALREVIKGEYAQKIKRLYNQNLTTLDRISSGFAIITERIMELNSLTPTSDESVADIEKIKTDGVVKLMAQNCTLLKLQASILGEMKSTGELMTIPTREFVETFVEAIQSAKTDRERELLKGLLSKFEALSKRTV